MLNIGTILYNLIMGYKKDDKEASSIRAFDRAFHSSGDSVNFGQFGRCSP